MIVGLDEVGRGCWAGPLVAGAVALDAPLEGVADSKVLSKLQRARLDAAIRIAAPAFGLGWVTAGEVDDLGLTEAVRLAMQRAFDTVEQFLGDTITEVIIDGNYNFFASDTRARAVISADATVPAVSAASIIAKVARDNWMANEAARQFPQYAFEKHVGYGTALHKQMLDQHGICVLHRQSFKPIRKLLGSSI